MTKEEAVARQLAEMFWRHYNGLEDTFPITLMVEKREVDKIEVLLAAARAARERAVWTDEKPTVPGWYWWRRKSTSQRKKIIHVLAKGRKPYLFYVYGLRYSSYRVFTGQWAGPIPAPEEEVK
mgnify:CR=1 FL=1